MNTQDISVRVLTPETNLDSFECTEDDLNEFLTDEAKDYQREYLAITYLIQLPHAVDGAERRVPAVV